MFERKWNKRMKIILVVGARPNFMKISPILRTFRDIPEIEPLLVHTGQHYDEKMSKLFFQQLNIPKPDINLEIGSASHAVQTAEIMRAFEPIVIEHNPDAVLVVGDVNSTIACGLVAVKLGIKLIHVEAGLRSKDLSMPEEINRILTDSISDLMFCTEQSGVDNLIREGKSIKKIFLVGNVMIDNLLMNKEKAETSTIIQDLGLKHKQYALLTLHRPSNVDKPADLGHILDAIEVIQKDIPLVFPIHPRTLNSLNTTVLEARISRMKSIHIINPLGYLDFLRLMSSAKFVLTDSGGIQEETTILKVPCLTMRKSTERPITIEMGSNRLVGTNSKNIIAAYRELLQNNVINYRIPPLWDGKASERIAKIILMNYF